MPNIEQGISNRRGKSNPHFEIEHSVFDILRFKMFIFQTREERSPFGNRGQAHSRKHQTAAAFPAEPGDLPTD